MIAYYAIKNAFKILHNNRDFDFIYEKYK